MHGVSQGMKITGLSDTISKLKLLDAKVEKQYVRKALKAGAKEMLTSARANAPSITGNLRKSIKVRGGKSRKGLVSVIVGLGKKWFTGPVFYGAFVEFGHHIGKRALGSIRTFIKPKPFIETAYKQKQSASVAKFAETLSTLVEGGK